MHNKIKTYNIPVDLVKSIGIKIEATNQFEAIKKVSNYLNSNETIKDKFSSHKIIGHDITCDQDDEIIDEIIEDFNLDIKKIDNETKDLFTHEISIDKCPDFIQNPGPQTLCGYSGCDIVWIINNRIIGIIQKIKFDTTKDLILKMNLAVFSSCDEDYNFLNTLKDATLLQVYVNEYGQRMVKDYNKITYIGEEYSPSVDMIYDNTTYIFTLSDKPGSFKTISDEEWQKTYAPIFDNSSKAGDDKDASI